MRNLNDPLATALAVATQFWSMVDMTNDGCWEWQGARNVRGYGRFRQREAHRVAWTLSRGGTGPFHVLHHCDNPPCVRPDHLFLGTHQDNISDMITKRRGVDRPTGSKRVVGDRLELKVYAGMHDGKRKYLYASVPVGSSEAAIEEAFNRLRTAADEMAEDARRSRSGR